MAKPLALGAPPPPARSPSRRRGCCIFDPSNERMRARVASMAAQVDVLVGNLEDAIPSDKKLEARAGLIEVGQAATSARRRCGHGSTASTVLGCWTT